MLEVSEEALEKLRELLSAQGGSGSAIRLALMGGGSDSPSLGLIVDEAGETDVLIDNLEVPIIIDRKLIEYCKSISIEFRTGAEGTCGGSSGSGFIITPQQPINL